MSDLRIPAGVNRRDFLATGLTGAAALAVLGAEEARAQEQKAAPAAAPTPPPVNVGVIGLGTHGKEIVKRLSRVPGANIVAVCDSYEPYTKRSLQSAPKATPVTDARQLLDRKDVSAVIIATPTFQHKDLVLAALQAGKHVYCEAPLAHTIADAKAIAAAAKANPGLVFQAGLQNRANPQHQHVWKMIRSGGVVGDPIMARAQVNINDSWRRVASNQEQTSKMNWHLRKATSAGLVGEMGIHSLDVINWYMKGTPVSVIGSSTLLKHKDGREVPDTAECTIEYAGGVRCQYATTLASKFDKTYELLMGSMASLMVRGQHAWLFKEVDAPLLGWEVYAKQEDYGPVSTADRERGFVLIADATKILALGKKPGEDGTMLDAGKDALYYSLEAFLNSARDPAKNPPACGPADALKATVTALKANEAALTGTKITYQKEWFTI